jgi:hypothetical protein
MCYNKKHIAVRELFNKDAAGTRALAQISTIEYL